MLAMAASAHSTVIEDWESGAPRLFAFGPGFIDITFPTIPAISPENIPGLGRDNTALAVDYNFVGTFGGVGQVFESGPQDWTDSNALRFWMFGTETGNNLQFEIFDNSFDGTAANSERFDTGLVDDFFGWQQMTINFDLLTRATDFQPTGGLDDGLTLTEVYGYALVLDNAAGFLAFDEFERVNVPAPGEFALLGLGILGMGLARRRSSAA